MPCNISQELKRKLFHLLSLFFPVTAVLLEKFYALTLFSLLFILVMLVEFLRFRILRNQDRANQSSANLIVKRVVSFFATIMRPEEIAGKRLLGITYLVAASIVCFAFFDTKIAIIAFIILAIADANAAIIGKTFTSGKFFAKSRLGSLAFFISAVLISIAGHYAIDGSMSLLIIFIIATIFITFIEACKIGLDIDDNLTIPLGFCISVSLLNYVVSYI
jgi:dolichol kinase